MEDALLKIEIFVHDWRGQREIAIESQVFQYPEIGSSVCFYFKEKYGQYKVTSVTQFVSHMPDLPPRVMVGCEFLNEMHV